MEVDATERLETRATLAALGVLVQRLLTSQAAPSTALVSVPPLPSPAALLPPAPAALLPLQPAQSPNASCSYQTYAAATVETASQQHVALLEQYCQEEELPDQLVDLHQLWRCMIQMSPSSSAQRGPQLSTFSV